MPSRGQVHQGHLGDIGMPSVWYLHRIELSDKHLSIWHVASAGTLHCLELK